MVRVHCQYLSILVLWASSTKGVNHRSSSIAFLQLHEKVSSRVRQPEDGVEELQIMHGEKDHDECRKHCMENPPCNMVVFDGSQSPTSCVLAKVEGEGDIIMLDGKKAEVKEKEEVLKDQGETPEALEEKQKKEKEEEEEAKKKKEEDAQAKKEAKKKKEEDAQAK